MATTTIDFKIHYTHNTLSTLRNNTCKLDFRFLKLQQKSKAHYAEKRFLEEKS